MEKIKISEKPRHEGIRKLLELIDINEASGVEKVLITEKLGEEELNQEIFEFKENIFHHACASKCDKKIIKLLILNGADINRPGFAGKTPLILAIQAGRPDIVELLLIYRANVCAVSDNFMSPLGWAAALRQHWGRKKQWKFCAGKKMLNIGRKIQTISQLKLMQH